MDHVVLNLYDGFMEFFETEEEALKAAALSLEQCRHLGPWANAADDPDVLVMRVTRRMTVTSKESEERVCPLKLVNRMSG
jgi:hypothetical protein